MKTCKRIGALLLALILTCSLSVTAFASLEDTGYVSSCTNPFESQYAPFGLSNGRYKYQWVYEKPMNTEEYEAALAKWEEERAALMANAE